jgi:tetratricopeptide (TPR) repeat protein
VADFGLARFGADAGLTMTGDLLGTLRYMAPEQALAKHGLVDHRADVYGLGATLYELLTLRPAVAGDDKREILERIAFADPMPPHRLDRTVPAELETIALKALAKNPEERYASAGELADDLRRFLEDRPILARRPTPWQRLARWARRHRPEVLTSAAALALLLVTAVAGLVVNAALIAREREEVKRQRDAAERARQEAVANFRTACRAVDQMLTRVASDQLKFIPQMELVQREILQDALKFYQGLLEAKGDDRTLRQETALVCGRLGQAFERLGQNAEAEPIFRQAIALLEELSAEGALEADLRAEMIGRYTQLGWLLPRLGKFAEAEPIRRQALSYAEQLAAEFPDSPRYRDLLAGTCIDLGNAVRWPRPREAEALFRRAIRLLTTGTRHELGRAYLALGELLTERGQQSEGEAAFRHAQAIFGEVVRAHPQVWQNRERLADAHQHLGRLLAATGRAAEADEVFRGAIDLREKLRAEYPKVVSYGDALATSYADLIHLLTAAGRPNEADDVYRKLVPLEPTSAAVRNQLAWLLATCPEPKFRDPSRAAELARNAVERNPRDAHFQRTLGVASYRAGDWTAAVAALKARKGADGLDWFFLAMAHWQLDEKGTARRWYDQAVQWMEKHQPDNPELRRLRAEAAGLLGVNDKP